jgi:hypothetical protein
MSNTKQAALSEVGRVEALGPDVFFEHYVRRGIPVVLSEFARDSPALRSLSLSSLAAPCGHESVRVQVVQPGARNGEVIVRMPFEHAIRAIRAHRPGGVRHYIQQVPVDELPPSLRCSLTSIESYLGPRYPFGRRWLQDRPRVWVGPAETVTPLHIDLAHNFFVQIEGRKRFTLFDPSQATALGFPSYRMPKLTQTELNLDSPDLRRFPAFASARRVVVDLEPGDALFLPHSWWHHVRALDPAVSLSHWWLSAGMLLEQRRVWFHRARRSVLQRLKRGGLS